MIALPPELIERVAARIDEMADQFRETGRQLREAFEPEIKKEVSAQLRNLERTATGARALYEVEYFVKNQMGRRGDDGQRWQVPGKKVLDDLERLRNLARELARQANMDGLDGKRLEHELRLRFLQGWIKVVVGEYMYQRAVCAVRSATNGGKA